MLDVVLVAQTSAPYALAAAALRAELIDRHRLDVAVVRKHDDELFVLDEIEVGEVARIGRDRRSTLVAVLLSRCRELLADDAAQLALVGQDRFELVDGRLELVQLVLQLLALECGQPSQGHVEDPLGLDLAEVERRHHQGLTRDVGRFRTTDQRDHRVDHPDGLEQAFEHVRALARLLQAVFAAARQHLDLVRDVELQRLAEVQDPRNTVDQREHVRGERRLHRRVLVELIEHDLRVRIALEVDDQPDGVARRKVAHVADAFDAPIVDELGDLGRNDLDRGLVRQLRHENSLPAPRVLVDLGDGAHANGTATGTQDTRRCRPGPESRRRSGSRDPARTA